VHHLQLGVNPILPIQPDILCHVQSEVLYLIYYGEAFLDASSEKYS
jgi:hypothetical protein